MLRYTCGGESGQRAKRKVAGRSLAAKDVALGGKIDAGGFFLFPKVTAQKYELSNVVFKG